MNSLRVVKLGGSLLDVPGIAARLVAWLESQPLAHNVIVIGGGELADAIRRADARHALGEQAAHWLCIRAMQIHAEMFCRLMPSAAMWDSWTDDPRAGDPSVARVADSFLLLQDERRDRPGDCLPEGWHVTSDSIAARLAERLDADELVLLKSCSPPGGPWEQWAQAGYIDAHFPRIAPCLRLVRAIDFRPVGQGSP